MNNIVNIVSQASNKVMNQEDKIGSINELEEEEFDDQIYEDNNDDDFEQQERKHTYEQAKRRMNLLQKKGPQTYLNPSGS